MKSSKFLIVLMSVVLLLTTVVNTSTVFAESNNVQDTSNLSDGTLAQDLSDLLNEEDFSEGVEDVLKLLTAIEEMPDDIIYSSRGQKAAWILEQTGINIIYPEQGSLVTTQASIGQIAACAGALGQAALLTFTPAKLLKVKAGLKAVGGAKTFVQKFHSAYKTFRYKEKKPHTTAIQQAAQRAASKAAPEARAALADLFGAGVVVGACSWVFEK